MLKTTTWRVAALGCSLGVLAGLLVVAFEADFPDVRGRICEYNQTTKHEDCTTYSIFPFLFIQIIKTLNDYGVAITALATVAIGIFTLTLKLSTDRLWEAGEKQLVHFETTAERQLRAYVFIDVAKFELAPNSNKWSIFLSTKNFGQTPAYRVVITIDREIGAPKPDDAILQLSANIETLDSSSMGPGAIHNVKLPCNTPCCNLAPGIGAWRSAQLNGNRAYLWGRIDYLTFKKRGWTTFQMLCVFSEIPEFGFCTNGNHSDEEEKT